MPSLYSASPKHIRRRTRPPQPSGTPPPALANSNSRRRRTTSKHLTACNPRRRPKPLRSRAGDLRVDRPPCSGDGRWKPSSTWSGFDRSRVAMTGCPIIARRGEHKRAPAANFDVESGNPPSVVVKSHAGLKPMSLAGLSNGRIVIGDVRDQTIASPGGLSSWSGRRGRDEVQIVSGMKQKEPLVAPTARCRGSAVPRPRRRCRAQALLPIRESVLKKVARQAAISAST